MDADNNPPVSFPASNELAEPLKDVIQSELKPGETLLWAGMPKVKNMVLSGMKLYPAVLIFCIFTAILTTKIIMQYLHPANPVHPLSGGAFVIAGIFDLIALIALLWPLGTYISAQKTAYVITSQRVFILTAWPKIWILGRAYADLDSITICPRSNGVADFIFLQLPFTSSTQNIQSRNVGFLFINSAVAHALRLAIKDKIPKPDNVISKEKLEGQYGLTTGDLVGQDGQLKIGGVTKLGFELLKDRNNLTVRKVGLFNRKKAD